MRQLFGSGEELRQPSWLSAGEPPGWGFGDRVFGEKPGHSLKEFALLGAGAAAVVAAVVAV